MQLAYIYQAWEWLTVKKKKKKKKLKYLLIAKVIVPITTGASRLQRGVQGPAEGPLVGIEGAKPPEAAGF